MRFTRADMLVIHAMPLRNKYKKKYEQEAE